jgi:hypothetical protein
VIGSRLGHRLPHRWLRPTWGRARDLVALAREVLAEADAAPDRSTPAILNVMFHNVEVTPATSPYAATQAQADAILRRLAALLAFARDAGIPSVGLGDLPEHLA